jgi:hypothetical protein
MAFLFADDRVRSVRCDLWEYNLLWSATIGHPDTKDHNGQDVEEQLYFAATKEKP